ncbi:hypothetical protein AHiyo1_42280 [Arthrobacter sp. Hiyo1]|nr:hypothetical protein AHiyo1_42280 [Arthrobacter sp. Hiyo1]
MHGLHQSYWENGERPVQVVRSGRGVSLPGQLNRRGIDTKKAPTRVGGNSSVGASPVFGASATGGYAEGPCLTYRASLWPAKKPVQLPADLRPHKTRGVKRKAHLQHSPVLLEGGGMAGAENYLSETHTQQRPGRLMAWPQLTGTPRWGMGRDAAYRQGKESSCDKEKDSGQGRAGRRTGV